MKEGQKIIDIKIDELLNKTSEFKEKNYRLVQISCTKTNVFEVNYSFDKEYDFINLKITLETNDIEIPSVSKIFWSAFLYENEMKDLYGLKISGMALDYNGNFYTTAVKFPFAQK